MTICLLVAMILLNNLIHKRGESSVRVVATSIDSDARVNILRS